MRNTLEYIHVTTQFGKDNCRYWKPRQKALKESDREAATSAEDPQLIVPKRDIKSWMGSVVQVVSTARTLAALLND